MLVEVNVMTLGIDGEDGWANHLSPIVVPREDIELVWVSRYTVVQV